MKEKTYAIWVAMTILLALATISSCKKNQEEPEPERPGPVITFEGDSSVTRVWGEAAGIIANLDAQAGLKKLLVLKDGNNFDEEEYPEGKVKDTYEIDELIADNIAIGTEIVYSFTITDRLDRSTTANFKITVGQPPAPELTFSGPDNALVQAGDTVDITLVLFAPAKAEKLLVSKNGAPYDTLQALNNATDTTLVYSAPTSTSLAVGETVIYGFELSDQLDRTTAPVDFTIEIGTPAPTFAVKDTTINAVDYKLIKGNINIDTVLVSSGLYLLSGIVKVMPNVTLTIEAGTTVFADVSVETALAVQTSAKLMAQGTASEPIVFTSLSDTPQPGDWGGIHINGLAEVASVGATLSGVIGEYGGTNNADNSGTVIYARVEYAGLSIGGSTGAFNLNAVGDQTTIDYIQVYKPNSRGLRIRGGKANIKHVLVTDPETRGIVWQDAWVGFGQFWVVTYSAEPPSAQTAIEGRDTGSNPTVSNVTVLSLGGTAFNNTRGVRFRGGTFGKMYNAIITDTERGVRADNGSDADINNGDLLFAHGRVYNNSEDNYRNDAVLFDSPNSPFFNTNTPVTLNGYVGTDSTGAFDPTSLDSWFSAAGYIGAVESGNDWTAGWIK